MLVSTEWLAAHLEDADLVVVDMRWREDGSGRSRYEAGHVLGAVYLDWSTDLVDPDHPIAFMLAPPDRFEAAMERCGIGDGSTVVAYADQFGSGPFRLWWACRMYGHDQVRVLDGGLDKWGAEGRPLSREPVRARPAGWTPRPREGPAARAEDVVAAEARPDAVVVDSRPREQHRGEAVWFETGAVAVDDDGIARTPRGDVRAGRIPWSVNVPAHSLYREDLTLKSAEELRELFAEAGIRPGDSAITYCGVGISASAVLFALTLAGVEARLYDESWEEWGRDASRPVARG